MQYKPLPANARIGRLQATILSYLGGRDLPAKTTEIAAALGVLSTGTRFLAQCAACVSGTKSALARGAYRVATGSPPPGQPPSRNGSKPHPR